MMETWWKNILKIHSNRTDTSERVVNLLAVFEVLRLCVSGVSNKTIADMLSLDDFYVREILLEFLAFNGLKHDLPFSPIRLYKTLQGRYTDFYTHIEYTFPTVEASLYPTLWSLCDVFVSIEKELENYDANN